MDWGSFVLFATDAATTVVSSGLDPLIATAGGLTAGTGFTLWLSRHLILNVIPKMQEQHGLALAAKDELHSKAIDKVTSEFKAELKEMWTAHRLDIGNLWSEMKGQSQLVATALNQLTRELGAVDRTMKSNSTQGNQQ